MLSEEAHAFYEEYRRRYGEFQTAAMFAANLVRNALRDSGFHIHNIDGRAKEPRSLLQKVRQKEYERPREQLTDQIAVRVITYFQDQVDPIAETLRNHFNVDESRSADRRLALSVREFGYRSLHLIAQARLTGVEGPRAGPLRELWFEIQVRSMLEHGWAEIEHALVYKSGVRFADEYLRRLSAAAAQLEAIDAEFVGLRAERARLVDSYRVEYLEARGLDEILDSARLAGLMEALHPDGESFRSTTQAGASLPPNVETICTQALRARGVETGGLMRDELLRDDVRERIGSYASLEGISAKEVSHFAMCVIVAGIENPDEFAGDYPDLMDDTHLRQSVVSTETDEYPEDDPIESD